jgi:hypothetical protein
LENQNYNNEDSRYQIKLISLISLGMFLFVLFFQPFDIHLEDFNDRLIFVLGIATITFLILIGFRIFMPVSVTRRIRAESIKISNEIGLILLIWVFITIGNTFYLYFVGEIDLNLSVGVKIAIFSSFPSIVLKIADVNMTLREQLRHFVRRNLKLEHDLAKAKQKSTDPIELHSDTKNDNIFLQPDDIMLIRSADNYVEVFYKSGEEVLRKLLRNTLKNIHQDLIDHPEFIRCHRTCIVNSAYILNLSNSYKGHKLTILDLDEEIPVSRQYILGIKEVIDDD